MLNYKKTFLLCLMAVILIVSPLSALADHPLDKQANRNRGPAEPTVMILDLVVVRPLGFVGLVGGSAFFIVSLPFSALGGNTESAWESLVVSPAAFTFKRPLGEFEQ